MSSNGRQDALHELDVVRLSEDIHASGLVRGQAGTIVHRPAEGQSFEVEFQTPGEEPVVITLQAEQIEKVWDAATRQNVSKPPATIEWE